MARMVRWHGLVAALMVSLFCGCGTSGIPSDATKAQEALHIVLDAWKAGEKPEGLARRTPSIHVSDVDWKGGYRLVGYKAELEGRLVGYDMNYPVVLELKDPRGKSVQK